MGRVLIVVGFLVSLGSVARGVEVTSVAPADVVTHATTAPGVTALSVHDGSAEPFSRPMIRLVALPPGATAPEVRLSGGDASGLDVSLGRPMVARGVTFLPVRITPADEGAARRVPVRDLDLEIHYQSGSPAATERARAPQAFSRGFFDVYASLLPREQQMELRSAESGGYVIITAPEYEAAVAPLAAWKRQMGFPVTLTTTDVAGATNGAILAYISDLYDNADPPPQYVLLVGDTDRLPGWDYHSSVSDHPYTLVDGDDWLPDLDIGRLSVQSVSEAETIVAKILRYQQDPWRDGGTEWFEHALVVAGDYGSTTPRPVSRWCRQRLLDLTYTEVDSVYFPPHWSSGAPLISDAINAGVSLVSYRGWAYGIHGWEPPHFTSNEVYGLDNGWMLPVVFSFVCQNNDFANEEVCFGEAWIRAGSVDTPRGAVSFIGNSEPWSHTRFNDAAAMGAFNAIGAGARRMGDILTAAKLEVLQEFPSEIEYDIYTDESVEFYFYIYSLLGDPELEFWAAPPIDIVVTHPDTLAQGSDLLEVLVTAETGGTPVAGARVGISQGDVTLGCGFTDGEGRARILADFADDTTPVDLTVTGVGVFPHRDQIDVVALDGALSLTAVTIDDDTDGNSLGNDDGQVNPGEDLELVLRLRNPGGIDVHAVRATLEALGGAEVVSGVRDYPDIPAAGEADPLTPFVVRFDSGEDDGRVTRFRLEITSTEMDVVAGFDLTVKAPWLQYAGHTLGGDGVLPPGASRDLTLTLRNDGSIASSTTTAILRAVTPGLVSVTDSTATIGPATTGETVYPQTDFIIEAQSDAAVGQAASFVLVMTSSEGYQWQTSFSIPVGEVNHRAPAGPDAYGYYAYDNSDTDYPDAVPLYDWVTCSPTYGGTGTPLALTDNTLVTVGLPFTFVYYGQSYDSMVVSDNGWVSFDTSQYYDFYNWTMPNPYGNAAQISPFWDNLDPDREIDDAPAADGIFFLHDAANHRVLVEWSRLPNARTTHDDLQTFQLVLYDPAHHPTPTGDGIVEVQYKQIVNDDYERMFATVGIEDHTEEIGLEYTYASLYADGAAPLSAGLVIRFTTTPPRYAPFRLARFAAAPSGPGVLLTWEPGDDRTLGGYRVYRADVGVSGSDPSGTRSPDDWMCLTTVTLDPGSTSYQDETADPARPYDYRIGSLDPIGHEWLLEPIAYRGASVGTLALALGPGSRNPMPGMAIIAYQLPRRAPVQLRVFDLGGRVVRTLVNQEVGAGAWSASWNGRDDGGRLVSNGVYFVDLRAGTDGRRLKVTVMR